MDRICNSSGIKLLDICQSTDLRIVNGRLGSDAGVGQFTFMSATGQSLIDYVIISQDIFPIVTAFVVHELHPCSSHVPIQINLKVNYKIPESPDETIYVDRLKWDESKSDEFVQQMASNTSTLNNIVDRIVSSECDFNQGVSDFVNVLYTTSFQIYGTSKPIGRVNKTRSRKYKSPWFTNECELARRELKRANKIYAKNRSTAARNCVVSKRKMYSAAKRRARAKFRSEQKSRLHNYAKLQPQLYWQEIKKIRGSNKTTSRLTSDDFYTHFKNLYSSENIFVNENVERELEAEAENLRNVEQLDCNFSIQEVGAAIRSLKRGKSSGEDSLIPEIFIATSTILSPIICRLFNYMFENSIYPDCWTRGIIVPVPKLGSPHDVNNYRGISVFSKIFSLILDSRLRKWAEENTVLSECQFGFREKRGTVDCIFVLTSIINNIIFREKKKNVLCIRRFPKSV
ncbi:MAG: hypothetical protein N0E48_14600 [Candidatus Thiodiazotropha endolucinida]|nr:hypothetical protein [Candidatus Thiodiazotropha taylori]MCW4344564.1 hypothetical protein [Candidatus Thiodiazotropha endolucinida]